MNDFRSAAVTLALATLAIAWCSQDPTAAQDESRASAETRPQYQGPSSGPVSARASYSDSAIGLRGGGRASASGAPTTLTRATRGGCSTYELFVAPHPEVTVELSPADGPRGTVITVDGEGYRPDGVVDVYIGLPGTDAISSEPIRTIRADRAGRVSFGIVLGSGTGPDCIGILLVERGSSPERSAWALFEFVDTSGKW